MDFASERALCDLLREASTRVDAKTPWICYPELGGWDLLIVLPNGEQIGVQAKLRPNVTVIAQALVRMDARAKGPDVHAVLIPKRNEDLRKICAEIGILVLLGDMLTGKRDGAAYLRREVSRAPRKVHLPGRCWIPPYVPDLPAGVPAPRVCSPWKVGAARACAELRAEGSITAARIAELGAGSMSTWRRWLTAVPGTRRPTRYRAMLHAVLPDREFPEVSAGLGLPSPT
jgi:hypothetical protein